MDSPHKDQEDGYSGMGLASHSHVLLMRRRNSLSQNVRGRFGQIFALCISPRS